MAAARTQAQIDADAAAAHQQAQQDQRERETQRQSGFLDFIKGFIPDFSFFGLLEMALLATGIYFLARTDMGQRLIHSITDHLSPETQTTILGLMNKMGIDIDLGPSLEAMDHDTLHARLKDQVPAEILDIIDPNDNNQTLHGFLDVIRGANGGKVTLKGFTSPATVTALMQQKPEMARALVIAALKPNANGQPSATATEMNASIKAIIASPQLDDLLNSTNRANTIHILAAALPPGTPVSERGLSDLLSPGKGLDADGRPTAALRQLFNDAVDGKKNEVVAGVYAMMGPTAVVSLIDSTKLTDAAAKYAVDMVQHNPRAKAAYEALVNALGNDKAAEFINAMQAPDAGNQISQLLLRRENVHALPQAVALLDALPGFAGKLPHDQAAALTQARQFLTPAHIPAIINIVNNGINPLAVKNNFLPNGSFSIDHAVDVLANPERRAEVNRAGIGNLAVLTREVNPLMTERNLGAIVRFVGAIDGGNPSPNSKLVLHRLARMATGTSMGDALKGLTGEQLAAFFSVPANRAAFNGLLDARTGLMGNTPAMQQELALLRKDFNVATGVGLGAILSDKDSARFLLNNANGGPGIAPEFVQRGWMMAFGGTALDNGQNRDILIELGRALHTSTASAGGLPTRTAQAGYSPVRGG